MIGSSRHNTVTLKQHSPGLIDFLELNSFFLKAEKSRMKSHSLQLNWLKNKAAATPPDWLTSNLDAMMFQWSDLDDGQQW